MLGSIFGVIEIVSLELALKLLACFTLFELSAITALKYFGYASLFVFVRTSSVEALNQATLSNSAALLKVYVNVGFAGSSHFTMSGVSPTFPA